MRFPLVKENTIRYPRDQVCAWCKGTGVSEPNAMAVLSGGALLLNSRGESVLKKSNRLDGYLSLTWHGAHDGDAGSDFGIYEAIPVALNVQGGQFDLYFCSTICLRSFLNHAVDSLESKVLRAKQNNKNKRRKQTMKSKST